MKKISLIYIVLLAFSLSIVAKADEEMPVLPEDFLSCSTGADNDLDGLTGFLGDPDCYPFEPAPEATSTPATTTEPVVPVPASTGFSGPSFGGGSSSGFSSGGITSGTPISNIISTTTTSVATTTVATTTCSDLFKTYMKKGGKNDAGEVKKLQIFLNHQLGLDIPVTGFFGNKTFNAVKQFQLKYKDNVLAPWNSNGASGYFYKTSLKQANLLICSAV